VSPPAQATEEAYELLKHSVFTYRGRPVGTVAACDPDVVAPNYHECFVRDFVPAGFVFLMDGELEIIENFLKVILELADQQRVMAGHQRAVGLLPASFKVVQNENGEEELRGDFGDMAIGRVAPVDSALWWMILLRAYCIVKGNMKLAHSSDFQTGIKNILELYLKESFETSPAMLVPDASFMIDRRMGVYGHPLEIQALFYGMLLSAQELLKPTKANQSLLEMVNKRMQTLRSYVRIYYWLDLQRLNEIHRSKTEEFGHNAANVLNIHPEIIPDWVDGWLDENTGYLIGNLGPSRMDFRFFSFGNLLSILFGLATHEEGMKIMNLYEKHWDQLVGESPIKIIFPAEQGERWAWVTGRDPKNVPWSYHNGGNWPCLIWAFTAAAIMCGRGHLAEEILALSKHRLPRDKWPEYYDGRKGSLIGRRANFYQTWTAAGLILSDKLLKHPDNLLSFQEMMIN
jgi:glycogen debranching enzyme